MRSCSILLLYCMLLFSSLQLHSQTVAPPSVDTEENIEVVQAPDETVQDDSEEETTEPDGIDTNFTRNQHLVSGDSVRVLKNSNPFAYAKNLDSLLKDYQKKQEQKASENKYDSEPSWLLLFFTSPVTQFIFWGLGIAFILFIVYKLFFTGGFFQRSTASSNIKILAEEDDRQMADKNYDVLIANAKREQNYRLATRYLYLQLLQKLTAAGAIEFTNDKTNTEYLRELTGKSYKAEVAGLTLNYEYVWYGEFAVNQYLFTKLEARFKSLVL